jgi:alanyl aminopeptidase
MIGDARPSTTPVRKTDAFRTGVNRYLAEHAWGNAAAEDLWSALSEASGKDLRKPLESFLTQPGYPLITARVAEADGGARLVLGQERFHNAGVEVAAQQWTVPMTVKLGRAGGAETVSVLLDRPRLEVALGDRPDWVLPNADAVGYYRWQVPEAELLELAEAADRRLTPVERMAFLGNAAALLDAGLLGGDGYLRVLHAFADDPEPQVTSALLSGLGKVRFAFVPDDLQPAFRRYLRTNLGPVAERYGLEPRPREQETVSLLRPQLVTWLGWVARDEGVVAFARRQAQLYLDDPAAVDPAVAGTVLAIAARDGDAELFETLRRRFETATDPTDRARFLGALGAFEASELRARALVYALEGPLRTNELFVIPFGYASDTEAGQERVFQWVLAHFDALAERLPPMLIDFMPRIGGGCSPERLQATEEFFGEDPWRTEGTAQTLAKVRDQVHDCLELRRREGAVVRSYLSAGEETGPQPTRRPSSMR